MVLVVGLAGSVAAAPARASPEGRRGFELGLQLGYGWPAGHAGQQGTSGVDVALGALVTSMLPLELHAGVGINSLLTVDLSFQYALASINDSERSLSPTSVCVPGSLVSCSASDVRVGASVKIHILPGQFRDPWVSVGAGYEWLSFSFVGSGLPSPTYSGYELANLQAGAYFGRPAQGITFGPFLGYSVGMYNSPAGHPLHEWLTLGVGGTFNIPLRAHHAY